MKAATFKLIKAPSYSSSLTGIMRRGASILLPEAAKSVLPPVFSMVPIEIDVPTWPSCVSGGLGDKIYSIPVVHAMKSLVGVASIDEPIFRLVKDNTRPKVNGDVSIMFGLDTNAPDLTEQMAELMGVELKVKFPVMATTEAEKISVMGLPDRFVVLFLHASSEKRSAPKALSSKALSEYLGVPVIQQTHRSPALFPMVERASLVITVNTGAIPMAGAFQVPMVAIDAPGRTSQFLDVRDSALDPDQIQTFAKELLDNRITCWCGRTDGVISVVNNLWLITCARCGTVRQDVKLTPSGLKDFYSRYYHNGWRSLVEGEIPYQACDECKQVEGLSLNDPYSARHEHDEMVSVSRIEQWKVVMDTSPKTWLDVGCSTGVLLKVLKSSGIKVKGLDLSPPLGTPEDVEIYTDWSKVKGKFDVVSFCDTLEHGLPLVELKNAKACLNSKGFIVVELPFAHENPVHYRRLQHLFYFTESSFKKLCQVLKLTIVAEVRPFLGKATYILKVI